jgi:hypothetical protein
LYLSIKIPGLFRRLIRSLFLQLSICDSRLLQKKESTNGSIRQKEHLLQEIYLLKEIFDTIPKVSPFNVYRAFRIRLFALSTEVVSKEAR